MQPDIRWIEAVFGRPSPDEHGVTHIAVPENGERKLRQMADELVGTSGMVALYVPEGTEETYKPGIKRGRVIAALQLLSMPADKRMTDYFYADWDGSRRWPVGWPARMIYAPPFEACPSLREHVETVYGQRSFAGFAHQFQHGPIKLGPAMCKRLNEDFGRLRTLTT